MCMLYLVVWLFCQYVDVRDVITVFKAKCIIILVCLCNGMGRVIDLILGAVIGDGVWVVRSICTCKNFTLLPAWNVIVSLSIIEIVWFTNPKTICSTMDFSCGRMQFWSESWFTTNFSCGRVQRLSCWLMHWKHSFEVEYIIGKWNTSIYLIFLFDDRHSSIVYWLISWPVIDLN